MLLSTHLQDGACIGPQVLIELQRLQILRSELLGMTSIPVAIVRLACQYADTLAATVLEDEATSQIGKDYQQPRERKLLKRLCSSWSSQGSVLTPRTGSTYGMLGRYMFLERRLFGTQLRVCLLTNDRKRQIRADTADLPHSTIAFLNEVRGCYGKNHNLPADQCILVRDTQSDFSVFAHRSIRALADKVRSEFQPNEILILDDWVLLPLCGDIMNSYSYRTRDISCCVALLLTALFPGCRFMGARSDRIGCFTQCYAPFGTHVPFLE